MLEGLEEEKSISIKEIYEKVIYYLTSVKNKWYVVILAALAGGLAIGLYAYTSKSYYEADLTFVVKTRDAKGIGLDNILGQLGWGASGGNANLPKVKSVAFSKSVLKEALYDSARIENKNDLIANHIANIYGFKEQWKDHDLLKTFEKFEIKNKDNDTSLVQNIAFGSILETVRANRNDKGILAITMDEETDMLSFKVRSVNEELSYCLSNSVFQSLNAFYLHDEVSHTKSTLINLKQEADSVGKLLRSRELQLANAQDRNYGIILRKNQANQNEIVREIMVLTEVYAQMRKNLEIRNFSLKTNTSIFDVLEHPVLPLGRKRKSLPAYTGVGVLAGLVLGVILLVIRQFLIDELK